MKFRACSTSYSHLGTVVRCLRSPEISFSARELPADCIFVVTRYIPLKSILICDIAILLEITRLT